MSVAQRASGRGNATNAAAAVLAAADPAPLRIYFNLTSAREFSTHCISSNNAQVQAVLTTFRFVPGVRFDWSSRPPRFVFPVTFHDQLHAVLEKSHHASVNPLPQSILEVAREKCRQTNTDGSSIYDAPKLETIIPECLLVQLAPFQRQGVEFILRNEGRALLADDMGLGKTRTSIAAAVAFPSEWPVLVVCPSSARHNWHAELIHLLVPVCIAKGDVLIVESASQALVKRNGSYKFIIVSYNLIQRLGARLQEIGFGVIICDECHYLKNSRANRTKALAPMIKAAKRAVLISGTPALSRPMELFTLLNSLDPKAWPDEKQFGRRYCRTISSASGPEDAAAGNDTATSSTSSAATGSSAFYTEFKGASNTQELHVLLTSTLMIRRLKKDILQSLPEKRREVVKVVVHDSRQREELKRLLLKFRSSDAEADSNNSKNAAAGEVSSPRGAKARRASSAATPSELPDSQAALKKERMGLLLQLFTHSGEAKLQGFLEHVKAFLDNPTSGQLLIFAHHRTVMDTISLFVVNYGVDMIRIDGSTSGKDRHDNTKHFQSTPSCRIALLAITAAGISITLTAAATVYFAEMFWTPGSLIQAEDRAHRIGQTRRVHVKYFLADNTVDDVLWPLVKKKVRTLGEVVEGDGGASFEHVEGDDDTSSPARKGRDKRNSSAMTSEADDAAITISRDVIDLTKDLGVAELESARTQTSEEERDDILLDDDDEEEPVASAENTREADDGRRESDSVAKLYMREAHGKVNDMIAATKSEGTMGEKTKTDVSNRQVVDLVDSDGDDAAGGVQYSNATDIAQRYLQRLVSAGKLKMTAKNMQKLKLK